MVAITKICLSVAVNVTKHNVKMFPYKIQILETGL